jgi:hypothetical protein
MAKRKAARASGRKATRRGASRSKAEAKKRAAVRKGTSRRATSARAGARKTARKTAARRNSAPAPRRSSEQSARKATPKKTQSRTSAAKRAAPKASARPASTARSSAPTSVVARKAPNLNRERRIVRDDDTMVSVPSSLDLDRRASAARTGRRELRERFNEHTETSPQLTGGDVDADWESAYSVGDEAPGGDNPTPDQDIVDDIGRAVGVEYQDNEELKGADKVAKRDKHRWELDPASSEDYDDRD